MPNFLQSIWLNKSKTAIIVSGISIISILSGSLILPNSQTNNATNITYNEKGQKVASAAGEQSIAPGGSLTMTYDYANSNAGEGGDATNHGLLAINIGSPFIIDVNSITDTFDTNGDGVLNASDITAKVCPSVVNTDVNDIGNFAGVLSYRPYSAKSETTCGGATDRGPIDFSGAGQMGQIKFKITLKPDILTTSRPASSPARNYVVNDVLTVTRNEGISAKVTTWIGATNAVLKEVTVDNLFIISPVPTNPLTLANISDGSCWEGELQNTTPIRVGSPSTCVFPLSGGTNGGQGGYSIPADFVLRLDNAASTATNANCLVKQTTTTSGIYNLECTNVPSTSATPGIQPITITAGGQTGQKGTVSLATPVNADTISSIVCSPNPQVLGTPVNCTVNLTGASPFIPSDFKLKIGTSVATNCSVTGLVNSNSFTCTGITTSGNTIPNGEPSAVFPIYQSDDNFTTSEGTQTLTPIINPVQNSNITSASCEPTTLYLNGTPATTTCTAQLDSNNLNGAVNFTLADMEQNCFAAVVSGQNTATCTITPTMASPAAGTPVSASVAESTGNPVSAGTLNILNIGDPVATTASPITGTVGSPMPNIPLTNSNVPNGTPVTFTPEGCTTGIAGTISNNTWAPATSTNIPDCALTNSRTGTLSAPNFPSVSVPTNFLPKPTIGTPLATTASPITGKIGNPMPNIPLTNSNLPTTTVVTFTPNGCTTAISGNVQNGTWVPATDSTIPNCATTGPQTGTLESNGLADVTVPTNFSPADTLGTVSASPITGIVGITPMPNIPLNGNTLPDGTSATFTPAGGTPIQGTIQNNSFVPSNGALIPANATIGSQNGVLSSDGVPSVNVPTNFSQPTLGTVAPGTILTGIPGQPFNQSIPLVGSNLPNGTPATFTPEGCTTTNVISGTIQNGDFVPTAGQTLPSCATTGAQTGTLTSPLTPNQSADVPTNFNQSTTPISDPGVNVGDAIEAINCIPDPTTSGSTVTCSGQLKSPYVQPVSNSPLKVKLDNTGATEAICTFNTNATFTCATANVGTGTGVKPVLASSGQNTFTPTPETITVNAKEITQPDLPNIGKNDASDPFVTFDCANNNTAIAGQTGYTCTGTLKNEYTLPTAGLKVGVGVAPTGICLAGTTTGTVNCTNVPVTQTAGQTPLKAQIGTGNPADTSTMITVQPKPTLGTTNTTVSGQVGTPLPSIPLPNTTLADNTVVTFTPEGASPISGSIIPVNGVKTWVPSNTPNIPSNVVIGQSTGTLEVPADTSITPLVVSTNFTPAPTIGNPTGGGLSGPIGQPVLGTVPLSGNLPNGTTATYQNSTACVIPGTIQNGAFVPNAGNVPTGCPLGVNTGGTITAVGQTATNIPTNFSAPVMDGTILINSIAGTNNYKNIVFTPDKATPTIFGTGDLGIKTLDIGFTPVDCTIKFRPTKTPTATWTNLLITMVGNTCNAILPAANQEAIPWWDYEVRYSAPDGQKYGENGSYFFNYGAMITLDSNAVKIP
jgi:hypothetical protein